VRRALRPSITIAALAAASTAAAAAPTGTAALTDFVCRSASNPLDRVVSVTAVMRPLPRTRRMALRFQLLRKAPGARRFTPVSGGDLGRWRHPRDPTLGRRPGDVWRLTKPVLDVQAPAVYRFRVTFRWILAGGRAQKTLYSPRCVQRGPRAAGG
jgi:hypothetical protein